MTKILLDSDEFEFSGTIESFMLARDINPDSFLFLINGTPVPMDTVPADTEVVRAIRVASGG